MDPLSEYLSEFAQADFEAFEQPIQSGLVKRSVGELQRILIKLGWRETTVPRPGAKDFGLFGPKTAGAWGQSATTRQLNPTFQRASSTEAYVDPQTLSVLSGGVAVVLAPAAPVAAPAGPAPLPPPASTLAGTSVSNAFDILYALGWTTKKLTKAKTYTKNLAQSWAISAKSRQLATVLQPSTQPSVVLVDSNTLAVMEKEARAKVVTPGTPPTEKVVAGTVVKTVDELQGLLYGVGWTAKKLTRDGKYGPQTKGAWGVSAKLRNLPQLFERVDGTHARVNEATYNKIAADAGAAPTPAPTPTPTPTPAPASDVINKSVEDVQKVLIKLGWKSTTIPRPGAKDFGLYGPKTKGAWESSTKKRGLDQLFERVDGKTARLNARSYVALLEETMRAKEPKVEPQKEEPKKEEPKVESRVIITLPTVTAYDILYKLGWTTKKLPKSDKFTPALANAWQVSSKTRGLDPKISKYDEMLISAVSDTIVRLTKDAEAEAAKKPKPGVPEGSVVVPVAEMQGIVLRLGEPKTKALTDGRFGSATQKAWERIASARGLNPGITAKVNDKSATVVRATYDKLKAEAGKPGPVTPTAEVEQILVLTVQQGLNILAKSRLKADGTWGSNTETALRGWLNKQPGGKTVKIVVVSKSKGTSMVQLPKAIVGALREAAKLTPAPTPKDDKERQAVEAVVQASTETVAVLSLQRMLTMARIGNAGIPPVMLSGSWDPSTQEAFMFAFKSSATPAVQRVWRIALQKLVSADMRSLRLPSTDAALVAQGEAAWKARGGPTPTNGEKPPPTNGKVITNGKVVTNGERPPPTNGKITNGELPTNGEPTPPPVVLSPEKLWDEMIAALASVYQDGNRYVKAVEEREAKGWHLLPEVVQLLDSWVGAAERVKQRTAEVLEKSPQAISAIDALGKPTSGAVSSLEAWLAELASTSTEILEVLKTPLTAAPMQGLEQWAQAASVAARLGAAAWPKLIELLSNPTLKAAVVTYIGVKGVGEALNADTVAYRDIKKNIDNLVADGKLTVEEAGQISPVAPGGWGLLVVGVVVVGAVALFLSRKGTSPRPRLSEENL
jgi:hypothetical protein